MIVGGLLIVGAFSAFFLGRAYERRVAPPIGARMASLPFENPSAPPTRGDTEVGAGDIFDQADDPATLEPDRQAAPAVEPVAAPPRPPAEQAATVPPDGGGFYVQVFAGRDQAAAAGLVRRLEDGGHSVRLLTEREGAGALYKVRVGGFSTRNRADRAATALQGQGYSGAWVTRER